MVYLISPFIWFLPPMAYRAVAPIPEVGLNPALVAALESSDARQAASLLRAAGASSIEAATAQQQLDGLRAKAITAVGETAYIRVCREVLPHGMMGMMLAAMFSATASTVSGHLNVFAGVLTNDFFARRRELISERRLVQAGRAFTLVLGALVVAVALCVRHFGGAERVVVAITSFMTVPLLAPVLAGLVSRRFTVAAVWATAVAAGLAAVIVKVLLAPDGLLAGQEAFANAAAWVSRYDTSLEAGLGVVLPCLILAAIHLRRRSVDPAAERASKMLPAVRANVTAEMTGEILSVVAWSLAACAAVVGSLVFAYDMHQAMLAGFGIALGLLSLISFRAANVDRSLSKECSHAQA